MSSRISQALVLLLALVSGTNAFVKPSGGVSQSRVNTELYGNTKSPPPLPPTKDISYGEESRQYRRTVYTHDDWVKHRSPDRFIRNLAAITSSGVYKNLANEVAATTSIATLICLYNAITGGFTDFDGVKHAALIQSVWLPLVGLPLAPFTLSSPSLGLLLGQSNTTCMPR
jgi:putative membrane protein